MNKADVGTAKEKDLFSRSPFLEMPMMFITSDEEVGQGSWAVFWFMFLGFSFLVSDYTLHSQHIVGATPFVDSGVGSVEVGSALVDSGTHWFWDPFCWSGDPFCWFGDPLCWYGMTKWESVWLGWIDRCDWISRQIIGGECFLGKIGVKFKDAHGSTSVQKKKQRFRQRKW